jgi:enoyl-[acyl-carrier-protein] reductase (NADH)
MLDLPALDRNGRKGIATAILATNAGRMLSGSTTYVDGGYHVMG